jgi:hypothetical protein
MNRALQTWSPRVSLALGGALIVVAVARHLNRSSLDADQPRPITWDEEACADCHMHIGDRRFAAQIVTARGDTLSFDDPGCLLRYLARQKPKTRALFFHHMREDRWLRAPKVAFTEGPQTPMGYNLGAVDVTTAGALSYADASQRVASRASSPEGMTP